MAIHPIRAVLMLCAGLCLAAPAMASTTTRTWVDADGTRWTETTTIETVDARVDDGPSHGGADRLVGVAASTARTAIARFGPFAVLDSGHAALIDATDSAAPRQFAAMLRAFPAIRVLELVDCPGTLDDTANLALGRMIRAHGLATDVPAGGSVRSGAVELFLAGTHRHAAADAGFGVHAWADEDGRGPADFPASAPANRAYLSYYQAMGMSGDAAARFYALTNSVPNSSVRWLTGRDIGRYISVD